MTLTLTDNYVNDCNVIFLSIREHDKDIRRSFSMVKTYCECY